MTGLVATDLDGTLLRRDGTISARTADVLSRVATQGVHVALVTGRPLRWLAEVCDQLSCAVIAVCANGAVVYDPATDAVLRADPLAPDLLTEVCDRLRAEIPDVCFAVEVSDGRELRYERVYDREDLRDRPVQELTSPADLYAVPAVKLLVRGARGAAGGTEALADRVSRCVAGLAEATHSWDSGIVEISAAGITKASGLAWLCERLDVPARDVVAFGDMPNDLPMLGWAGRSVAVRNAHPLVREAADDVTDSNDDDGVAHYLERLLRGGTGTTGAGSADLGLYGRSRAKARVHRSKNVL